MTVDRIRSECQQLWLRLLLWMPVRWFRRRLLHMWIIARHDSTAWAELASGFALLLIRGIILVLLPPAYWPIEVAVSLYPLNEAYWGFVLLMLGMSQMLLAGSVHHLIRILIVIAIIFTFAVVGVAYALSGFLYSQLVLSFTCLITFETLILIRAFRDRAGYR